MNSQSLGTSATPSHRPPALRPRQLDLLRRTLAKDCTSEEYDLFIEAAERTSLDPFRRQILPVVFNKRRPEKRRMVILLSIDGQRIIAHRCGNYRPASEAPEITTSARRKGPTNPAGIVCARVRLWQQDNRGDWFPVIGEACWDEFAPIRDRWAEDPQTGRYSPTGEKILDPESAWVRMPRLMIVKCATMQALRAGWPDEYGGLYAEEEMDRARAIDLAASEIVERQREEDRLVAVAANDAIMVWWPERGIEHIPIGRFADAVLAWAEAPDRTVTDLTHWREANREALRFFWAKCPSDALSLKSLIERRIKGADSDPENEPTKEPVSNACHQPRPVRPE